MPAVVVGAHADERVGDFGFPEQLAFGHGGHVDDGDWGAGGQGAVEEGFGARGELGALWFSWGGVFVSAVVGFSRFGFWM